MSFGIRWDWIDHGTLGTMNITHLTQPPLSLYIHIPWCTRKCPYCDFNSHVSNAIPEKEYSIALIEDLDQDLDDVEGRELQSIFFGGGTPSLFSAKSIGDILQQTSKRLSFAADIEITLEANPGSIEQKKFSDYHAAGVNRLSIGVQSFNQRHLDRLGRIHSSEEAVHSISAAKAAGFTNFNIDLMHGLPEQSEKEALADLQQAIDLQPTHISWYQLTIEPNTAFYNAPPTLPSDNQLADIQEAGEALMKSRSYLQYEVSAFSLMGNRSRHNMNYWTFGDYIGIGAGAHGKMSNSKNQSIRRSWKTRSPKDYLNPTKNFRAGVKQLKSSDLSLEFAMNALRLNRGFDISLFRQATGLDYSAIEATVSSLKGKGLLREDNGRVYASDLGRRFLNEILTEF